MLSQIVSGFVGHLMDFQVSNHVVLGESSSLLCHSSSICILFERKVLFALQTVILRLYETCICTQHNYSAYLYFRLILSRLGLVIFNFTYRC